MKLFPFFFTHLHIEATQLANDFLLLFGHQIIHISLSHILPVYIRNNCKFLITILCSHLLRFLWLGIILHTNIFMSIWLIWGVSWENTKWNCLIRTDIVSLIMKCTNRNCCFIKSCTIKMMGQYNGGVTSLSGHWGHTHIAKFMGPKWGPSGTSRPQMGPMLAPWTLLSGYALLLCSPINTISCNETTDIFGFHNHVSDSYKHMTWLADQG